MTEREQTARNLHRSGYSCSQAAYTAYAPVTGLDAQKARRDASGWAGGAKIRCGAVYACEQVIAQLYPLNAREKIAAYEEAYAGRNGSVDCRKLLQSGGRNRKSCNDYVGDAVDILEAMLREDGIA